MNKLHRSIFLKEVKQLFPAIRDELNQQCGLLHLEMQVFYRSVQDLIDNGERNKLTEAFRLMDSHVTNGNREIVNAISVSFLERLNFTDGKTQRAWAKALMPAKLGKQFDRIEAYHEKRGID